MTQQPSSIKQGKREEDAFLPQICCFLEALKTLFALEQYFPLVFVLLQRSLLLFPKAFWPRKIILKALCLKAKRNVCKVRFSSVRLRRARQMFMISSSLAMWCQAIFSHSEWHRALCWDARRRGKLWGFFSEAFTLPRASWIVCLGFESEAQPLEKMYRHSYHIGLFFFGMSQ